MLAVRQAQLINMNNKAKKTAILGMAAAAAMILSYVESFFSLGIPGLKIGLPNVFIVCVLYLYGVWDAAAVSAVRCVLTALLFGSMMSFWYSIAGTILSLTVMALLRRTDRFSPVAVSVAGGVSHNLAQIGVAIAVTGTEQIAYYLPVLVLGGIAAGTVIGIAAGIIVKRVRAFL